MPEEIDPKKVAEDFRNKPAGKLFPEAVKRISMGKCATCGKDVNHDDFRKDIDRRKFKISGMCQKCQDSVFKPRQPQPSRDDMIRDNEEGFTRADLER